jgi:hypothetical protein
MNSQLPTSNENPETFLTDSVVIIDAEAIPYPPGTKAPPRPPGRPRPTGRVFFFDAAIYTIAQGQQLAEDARSGGPVTYTEKKAWAKGFELWQKAKAEGSVIPILFGDATDCSRLEYWGMLTNMERNGKSTRYTIDRVRTLQGQHKPQDLILRSTGKHIAPNFIRSYAICNTPSFLSDNCGS